VLLKGSFIGAQRGHDRRSFRGRERGQHFGGSEIAALLVAGLTDAVASVLGEQARSDTSVELVATPEGRVGLGGAISE
jgi:hypothetical protein